MGRTSGGGGQWAWRWRNPAASQFSCRHTRRRTTRKKVLIATPPPQFGSWIRSRPIANGHSGISGKRRDSVRPRPDAPSLAIWPNETHDANVGAMNVVLPAPTNWPKAASPPAPASNDVRPSRHLTGVELRQLLDMPTRFGLVAFLKRYGMALQEFAQEGQDLDQLGF
jgi:hypothetical protein